MLNDPAAGGNIRTNPKLRKLFSILIRPVLRATILRSSTFLRLWSSIEGQLVNRMTQRELRTSHPEGVIVLGRGLSLGHLISASPDYADVIVANFKNRDLDDPNLRRELESRSLHIVGNIGEPVLPFRSIKGMTIGNVYFCRPDVPKSHKFGQKRWTFRLNRYGKRVKYFPSQLAEGFDQYKNVGLMSIYLAVADWKVKECVLFGFDFYETDYFSQGLLEAAGSIETKQAHQAAGKEIKKQLIRMVESFPETDFKIYTYGTITDPPENLSVEQLTK